MSTFQEKTSLIMKTADILRGVFKPEEYDKIILPMVLLKRFDSVLEDVKDEILEEAEDLKDAPDKEGSLKDLFGQVINDSKFNFKKLEEDHEHIKENFKAYINGYSSNVKNIIRAFNFEASIDKLHKHNLLYEIIRNFNQIDFHPDVVSNSEMGAIFEQLIRLFSENALAGDHYTPREVIALMTELVLIGDEERLKESVAIDSYDPTCGTNGINSVFQEKIKEKNLNLKVYVYGQEINEQSHAIGQADLLLRGEDESNIKQGNTLTNDQFPNETFNYIMANPPYGITWKAFQKEIADEHKQKGFSGRFGAGLPRTSDGSLLFVQHMISKMKPNDSKVAVVLNGSPLFTGDAGSGESDIRKWILENDLLEGIVALPTDLFFNTGIATYIWILNNHKPEHRKGKVQLINAVDFFEKMAKSMGNKRKIISPEQIQEIRDMYEKFEENKFSKIYDNEFFGYRKVEVRRTSDKKWKDTEQIPIQEDVQVYMEREVLPHIEDAYIDESKTKIGYEINFTRYFYEYKPLRKSSDILSEFLQIQEDNEKLMKELFSTDLGGDSQ